MRVTFYVAAFFAIICSLQHMVLAEDSGAEKTGAEKVEVAPEVPEADVEPSAGHYEPDSDEYHKHMEELSAVAAKENEKLVDGVPSAEHDKAAYEEMKKLMAAETADSEASEVDHDADIKIKDQEKGMDNPPEEEEEEVILPTKYPEINGEMTHVSYVEHVNDPDDKRANEVQLTLEYSYFKGADQYELCGNCQIEDGKRVNADTDGEVKAFTKDDPLFCDTSPACFAEIKWTAGQHTFSMRAHTDAGWTEWSPNYNFHINREVGPASYIHEDL